MKKHLFLIVALLLAAACTKREVVVPDNQGQIDGLTTRADLNDTLNQAQQAQIDLLNAGLAAETAARIAGDASLQSLLDSETAARIQGDNDAADALSAEICARISGDNNLQNQLNAEAAARQAGDTANANAILAEAIARSLGDGFLAASLVAERAARIAGDTNLTNQIVSERNARIAADNTLQAGLNAEAAARAAGYTALADALHAANAAQATVNAHVQSQISSINGTLVIQGITDAFFYAGITLNTQKITQLQSQLRSLQAQVNAQGADLANLTTQVNNLASSVSQLQSDMGAASLAITQLQDQQTTVFYPCGDYGSADQEIFLRIWNQATSSFQLVAFFEQVQNVTNTYTVNQIVPSYFVCDHYDNGHGNNDCSQGHTVASYVTTQNITITSQVLVKAFLDDLVVGLSYQTTDGYGNSCSFTVGPNGTVTQ
jgi:uncharacterized protein YoxC